MVGQKPIAHCAGLFTNGGLPMHPECQDCVRRCRPIPARGEWIAPPDFLDQCPEKLNQQEQK